MAAIFIIILLAIYFIPTLVANSRNHKNTMSIFLLNLFLGWTFLGWVAALVWSFTAQD
ncbi:MAG: superinfection immunity protein [Zymomonas mobilis]|uniref:T4 immunity holin family protein n=1 Tax=Zymomonas mobilis TaxID=542 RepID=A0A542VZD1_ZYMMB|nr:superinfection immunity protein [Zymomonas mobilis]TQL16676.1 T4 immunity holin family protein [Zymomonas mobilis]